MDPALSYERYKGPRSTKYASLPQCGHSSCSKCNCADEEGYGDGCVRDRKWVYKFTEGMHVLLKDLQKADVKDDDLKKYNDESGTITKVHR